MPQYDLPLADLERYRGPTVVPEDLDEFWSRTLAEARALGGDVTGVPVDTGLRLVDTLDVTFPGFGGDPVRAWLHRPSGVDGPLPTVVRYQGYGGGRGAAHIVPVWTLAGYACLNVDTRGQGSAHSPGDTPDPSGSGPAYPGYLTRGVLDPSDYYYRRVFTDAVRAVDALADLPGVDTGRVAVAGGSQGGGISIAVAALRDDVRAVLADVPFLSDFRRSAELATVAPYTELTAYLATHSDHVERVFATLAYFDAAVLATRATARALFSVALMDRVCPPSTVYATFNAYAGDKEITVWPFNDHEGGQAFQEVAQMRLLAEVFG